MIDVTDVADDGFDFARRLLDDQRVSVLPGESFGEITRDYVRLSLTHPVEILEEAFNRIENFIQR